MDIKNSDEMSKGKSAIILVVVVVSIVLLLKVFLQLGSDVDMPNNNGLAPLPLGNQMKSTSLTTTDLVDDDYIKGSQDAPITIIEFSDFECPYCVRFFETTYGPINDNFIDTGIARLIFRDYPLDFHKEAQKASEAAQCAGDQGQYYEMHDLLFGKGVVGGKSTLYNYAEELNLDIDAFKTCLNDDVYEDEVQADMAEGKRAFITGTPAFLVFPTSGTQEKAALEAMIPPSYPKNVEVVSFGDSYGFKVTGALPYTGAFEELLTDLQAFVE